MKPSRVVGIVLGILMMAVAIGAFFSGEPASMTQQGRVVTIVAFIFGFAALLNGITSSKPPSSSKAGTQPPAAAQPPPQPPVVKMSQIQCPSCKKSVSLDHCFCPYCGSLIQKKCPSCGRQVSPDFSFCPHCSTRL